VGVAGGGNDVLRLTGVASALDYLEIKNGTGIGAPLHILASGASANIGVHLQPKGTGLFTISDGTDFNKGIRFRSSSSAASAVTLIDAVSTAGRVITLPDITGTLATLAGTEALSNKTITSSSFSGTTGSFTTLSATGDVTASGGNILNTSGGTIPIRFSGATTGSAVARFGNTGGDSFFGAEGNATNNLIVGCTAYDTIIRGPSGIAFSANAGSAMQMRLSSTGLAVTGALSATGNITLDSATTANLILDRGSVSDYNQILFRTAGANTGGWDILGSNTTNQSLTFYSHQAAGVVATLTATGLAVTGALSATSVTIADSTAGSAGAGALVVTGGLATGANSYIGGKLTQSVAAGTVIHSLVHTSPTSGVYQEWKTNSTTDRAYIGTANQVISGGSIADFAINSVTGNIVLGTASAARLTIGSAGATFAGAVTIGGATEAASIRTTFTGNTIDGISLKDSADQSNAVFAVFRKTDGTGIGSISRVTTTNAVAYNTTSDGRLKTNVRDFTAADAARIIEGLRPRWFDWKSGDLTESVEETIDTGKKDKDGKNIIEKRQKNQKVKDAARISQHIADNKSIIGFIAQEEAAVDPALVRAGAVTVGDNDPTTITRQWARSDAALVPVLVAELKSLRARVADLEKENASLDARMAAVEKLLKK
jgi:hypothetical protein